MLNKVHGTLESPVKGWDGEKEGGRGEGGSEGEREGGSEGRKGGKGGKEGGEGRGGREGKCLKTDSLTLPIFKLNHLKKKSLFH